MKTKILMLLLFACLVTVKANNEPMPRPEHEFIIVSLPKTIEERIDLVLEKEGFEAITRRMIIAQAKHESGNFTNKLTRKSNNVFAMLWTRDQAIYAISNKGHAEGRDGYAVYANIENSTRAFAKYYRKRCFPEVVTSVDQYAKMLKEKGYYTDKEVNYANALRKHFMQTPA